MKIIDLYTPMRASIDTGLTGYEFFETNEAFRFLLPIARGWQMDQASIEAWLTSPEGVRQNAVATGYLAVSKAVVRKVETLFGRELPGILVLMPSFADFDGFARYDLGQHFVLLGIDFPDADVEYLKALTAHELSHVYRDHAAEVWAHLGKPLPEISRQEYLDAGTAQEHLVSEGLATLFSQAVFPEIEKRIHHYYDSEEWEWCLQNDARIEAAFVECLHGDEDVWSFYRANRVARGSPSRTQYYWAAKKLKTLVDFELLAKSESEEKRRALEIAEIVRLHLIPASRYPIFKLKA